LNARHFVYWMSIGAGNGELRSLFLKERETGVYGNIGKEAHKLYLTNISEAERGLSWAIV
jgi:hypothetical protein